MTTSAREWRAAREEDIRRAYADKECWNDLDRITCQHPYNFNAIEQWPLDAAVICKPTDRASVLLGSIKAACSLEHVFKTLSVKVTVVVTMCANGMEIRGAPKDWARYFKQEKVFHIKCHLEDTTLKPPHRWEERIPDLVASCLEQWKIVCGQLWKQSMLAVTRGESMHVLFHCFGGINRSAGALCAWLGSSWVTTTLQRMPSSCFLAPLAQSPLCLGGFVEAGRFAYRVAHGTECGGRKLICTTVRLERNCSRRTCKISSQLLSVCTVENVEKCWSTCFCVI